MLFRICSFLQLFRFLEFCLRAAFAMSGPLKKGATEPVAGPFVESC